MKIKGKCTKCLTGKKALEIDRCDIMCPYIHCYIGKKCPFYKKMKNKKDNLFKKILSFFLR